MPNFHTTLFQNSFVLVSCLLTSFAIIILVYSLPMVPRYLFCLFLCTAAPPAGFSIYIFINTTVTFIGSSGHSVQMS